MTPELSLCSFLLVNAIEEAKSDLTILEREWFFNRQNNYVFSCPNICEALDFDHSALLNKLKGQVIRPSRLEYIQAFLTARVGKINRWGRRMKARIPYDRELLEGLYNDDNMTTPEIAKLFKTDHHVVCTRMRELGISRRKVGISRYNFCIEKDCGERVQKTYHQSNGSWYGKRCVKHWNKFRTRAQSNYWHRRLKPIREAFKANPKNHVACACECGQTFFPYNGVQKYFSEKCKHKANRETTPKLLTPDQVADQLEIPQGRSNHGH